MKSVQPAFRAADQEGNVGCRAGWRPASYSSLFTLYPLPFTLHPSLFKSPPRHRLATLRSGFIRSPSASPGSRHAEVRPHQSPKRKRGVQLHQSPKCKHWSSPIGAPNPSAGLRRFECGALDATRAQPIRKSGNTSRFPNPTLNLRQNGFVRPIRFASIFAAGSNCQRAGLKQRTPPARDLRSSL